MTTEFKRLCFFQHSLVTRLGNPPSPRSLRRWCVVGKDGRVLRSVMRDGFRYTTQAWVREFTSDRIQNNPAKSRDCERIARAWLNSEL